MNSSKITAMGAAAGFKRYEKPGVLLGDTIVLFRAGRIKIKPQQTGVHNGFEPTQVLFQLGFAIKAAGAVYFVAETNAQA